MREELKLCLGIKSRRSKLGKEEAKHTDQKNIHVANHRAKRTLNRPGQPEGGPAARPLGLNGADQAWMEERERKKQQFSKNQSPSLAPSQELQKKLFLVGFSGQGSVRSST